MNWEIVIGLETHVQLRTQSKIFSGAAASVNSAPNENACGIDIALPGVLPVLNRQAVVCAILFGLAAGSTITPRSIFARKNYFYPDLPKGYQISQFEHPVVSGGSISFILADVEKTVRLTRAHLEEDAGKSLHELDAIQQLSGQKSGIDLNRAGTPLLEIVTEPDMRSAAEAVAYARSLHALVQWIGICDGNMQEGSFRCDANVSVRRPGAPLGTRREIKNLNSFRFLQQAIDFEARWQIETLEDGGKITQATVLFDPDSGQTRAMRSKEDAHDYRYFPDPDLLPLEITPEWIAEVRSTLPELPQHLRQRLMTDYGLSAYDAALITSSREMAHYFTELVMIVGGNHAKLCANWLTNEVSSRINREDISIALAPLSPAQLAGIIQRIADGTLTSKLAREVFDALWRKEGDNADAIIAMRGLEQINDGEALTAIITTVLANNTKSVAEFRAGKDKALNALVGQVMKAAQGKTNPQQVSALLRQHLLQGD